MWRYIRRFVSHIHKLVANLNPCIIELSEQKKEELKLVIEKITLRSIGKNCPKGFCFSTSFVLSIYLRAKGISNCIVGGKMNGCDHFWLNLKEYDDIIIDATIKQFDKSQDDIYIGRISGNEITRQYNLKCYSFNEWINLYQAWSNPEFCSEGIIQREKELFRKIVVNNLISASILIYEIEKMEESTQQKILSSSLFKLYFQSIWNGLKNGWEEDEGIMVAVKSIVEEEFKMLS